MRAPHEWDVIDGQVVPTTLPVLTSFALFVAGTFSTAAVLLGRAATDASGEVAGVLTIVAVHGLLMLTGTSGALGLPGSAAVTGLAAVCTAEVRSARSVTGARRSVHRKAAHVAAMALIGTAAVVGATALAV